MLKKRRCKSEHPKRSEDEKDLQVRRTENKKILIGKENEGHKM